jgi:glucuronate isomerase
MKRKAHVLDRLDDSDTMTHYKLVADLEEALAELPMFDVHTHLVGGRLGARGLHDILLYHMVVSDLYAAGCPSGARLTQYPGRPTREEAHARLAEAVLYLPSICNTSCFWMVRTILRDLYGWNKPITADNWRQLDSIIRQRADDRAWPASVFDRVNIRRTCTEYARREGGADGHLLQYCLEWAFFTRYQWNEYDTALYELERCWGRQPEPPSCIGGQRPPAQRTIRNLEDVHTALNHYINAIPYDRLVSTATTVSTDIDYDPVTDDAMAEAIGRRDQAGIAERDIYSSYINEAFLAALEARPEKIVFQFSLGAEPLPYETGSLLYQRTIRQIAEMISRHPQLHFQCSLASRHSNQAFCTMARELPNLSLSGYWWHNFFPDAIRQVMSERLDMLPVNKQIGFFSDAYCVEWVYGKARMVQKQMARVLAEKIQQGQYTRDDALDIARTILFKTPQNLLGMAPAPAQGESLVRVA